MRRTAPFRILVALAAFASALAAARAQTYSWSTSASSGNMGTGGNWSGGTAPAAAGDDTIAFTSSTTTAVNNNISGLTVKDIYFNSGSGAFTLSGDAITVTAGILQDNTAHAQTIDANLITSGSQVILYESNAAAPLNIVGAISGSANIVKGQAGTLTLSGANTYTGNTTINNGMLVLEASNALAGATGTVMLNGGSLTSSVSSASLGGSLSVAGGTLDPDTGAGTLTLASGAEFSMDVGTIDLTLGTSYGQIAGAGSGTFSITGGDLALSTSGAGFSYSDSYQILTGFASGSVSGVDITGYNTADYTAALSNTGTLTFVAAVPEPGTYAIVVGVFVLGFAALRRRRSTA